MIFFSSCLKSNLQKDYTVLLDSISSQKYYQYEELFAENLQLYGTWKVIGTSGGFSGQGYEADFDYLVVKPYLIFGIIRNDSLISTGKIEILNQDENEFFVNFKSDQEPEKVGIQLIYNSEKYIFFSNDSLTLYAPCCDRYNTHLKKVK